MENLVFFLIRKKTGTLQFYLNYVNCLGLAKQFLVLYFQVLFFFKVPWPQNGKIEMLLNINYAISLYKIYNYLWKLLHMITNILMLCIANFKCLYIHTYQENY